MMLEIKMLRGGYIKNAPVLNGLEFNLRSQSRLAVFGQNGAGKSTLAKAIMGLLPYSSGSICYDGLELQGKTPDAITRKGIGYFWQGGRVFPHLSPWDNLRFAAGRITRKELENKWMSICQISPSFASLQKKLTHQTATYLSGGERHLLALGMVLIRDPELLILDEPSAGLAPSAVDELFLVLDELFKTENTTILLIEQNLDKAMAFCEECLVLTNGTIARRIDLSAESAYSDIEKTMFEQ
ncbi:MAG: ATP-binding cassette domain-containing protein [Kiritimatiellae bacterium]|nr:ATP-binding cassette domain-containing protein [Kiritimatiellia bacterium]